MASTLKINTLTGVTTAGSIAVTGEGNSTTTNLQQGLTKAWVNFGGGGTAAIKDSFNITGITDQGTGQYQFEITNDMANTEFALPACTGNDDSDNAGINRMHQTGTASAGNFHFECADENDTNADATAGYVAVHGDLA